MEKVYAAFIDLVKIFDVIDWKGMWGCVEGAWRLNFYCSPVSAFENGHSGSEMVNSALKLRGFFLFNHNHLNAKQNQPDLE